MKKQQWRLKEMEKDGALCGSMELTQSKVVAVAYWTFAEKSTCYLATDSLFPEWKIWSQFLYEITADLKLDGLAESHPIEVEINHIGEIDEIFDASYAVLYRMNEAGINPDVISYNSLISSAARKCFLSKY
ncbi:hypothetical protein Lal_00021458 [Lupinus albus]|nr:hypothetical protein Lal_00021458 [Lupinus albus]